MLILQTLRVNRTNNMAKVGYARVSSVGQSLDIQIDKLKASGCEKIYQEKRSGVTADRPELKAVLDYLREGDSLVITKLDRLARSTFHLTQIAEQLKQQDIDLIVLDQHINTSTPTGKLLFTMLASIAEFETEIRKERQREGIAKAREKGIHLGAQPKLTSSQLAGLKADKEAGIKVRDLMAKYYLSKSSIYRLLQKDK